MSDLGPLSEVVCVRAESFAISGPAGDIVPGGDQGFYVRDTRFLDRVELRVDGDAVDHLIGASVGGHHAVFHGYVRRADDRSHDPQVLVTRRRVIDGGLCEEIVVRNAGDADRRLRVEVRAGSDFAYIFDVKQGRELARAEPRHKGDTLVFTRDGGIECTEVRGEGAAIERDCLVWEPLVPAGGTATLSIEVTVTDPYGTTGPGERASWAMLSREDIAPPPSTGRWPQVDCSDTRFARLVRRSIADLESLTLIDPESPHDRFAAAGSPWFLTLFGRDSIWAALMALPYDPDLADGTLHVLARRQGQRTDVDTEERPGKILHEVRRGALAERGDLPPHYYGSVDSTPLFIILAHEAWRWGMPEDRLEPLVPNVEAALAWIRDYGDPNDDGFVEYACPGERGLTNQGWKDSHDGVRFADGRFAEAPIALCEVQGYAYAAAIGGATLLERFGRGGGDEWRSYADTLRRRFRDHFWAEDETGPYPVIALDGRGDRVDSIASNMGHLLFTGILDTEEAAAVAARLRGPDMTTGWGLRTLSTRTKGYNPLSYHCGSVWPHDTAIAIWGLARSEQDAATVELTQGLVRAAPTFNFRLPELFAGLSSEQSPVPVPYPASCRPQAWAAGGALLITRALLGMEADLPHGTVSFRPVAAAPFAHLSLTDLPLGGGLLDVEWKNGSLAVQVHNLDIDVVVTRRE